MTSKLTGGCACGAARYSVTGEPKFAFRCQCRACQYMSGSGHAAQFACDADGFEQSGKVTEWTREAASGNPVTKVFCPVCGTTLFGRPARAPELVMVTIGTLDDPSQITPERVFYADEAQPWDHLTSQEGAA